MCVCVVCVRERERERERDRERQSESEVCLDDPSLLEKERDIVCECVYMCT